MRTNGDVTPPIHKQVNSDQSTINKRDDVKTNGNVSPSAVSPIHSENTRKENDKSNPAAATSRKLVP